MQPTFGQVYLAQQDVPILVGILYKGAASGGADAVLPKGTSIVITSTPPMGAEAVQALPLTYGSLEKQIVPGNELASSLYQSYGISILLSYLQRHFVKQDYARVEFDDRRATETWQLVRKSVSGTEN